MPVDKLASISKLCDLYYDVIDIQPMRIKSDARNTNEIPVEKKFDSCQNER